MKANELRLGNLLQTGVLDIVTVISIMGESIQVEDNNSHTTVRNIGSLSPIPLTAEWMERFGFKYEGGTGYLAPTNTEHWYTTLRNGFMPNAIARGSVEKDGYVGCHFVHQLQNLFYALTGEELTLKDK
jgi:hypothetical protein